MPIEFRQHTLDNGLTVIGEPDPAAHTAAIGFFVKTGARDEDPAAMGVSHFLEHMMFKGTATRTAADVDLDFDNIGADHNAFTTNEMTAFYCHCLPEHLPCGAEILADILRPSVRQSDFDDEKTVILEEIAMYQDHPFWVLYEKAQETFYGSHPLGHRVLGTPDTVAAMTREQMVSYFDQRYSADNTVAVLAGRFDFDAMTDHLSERCGAWTRTEPARVYPDLAPPETRFTIESPKANRHYIIMISPAPAIGDERRYAAAMLGQILGGSDGSRLYWALIESGLADEALAQYDGRDGTGESVIYASCDPADAEKIEQIALDEAAKLVESLTDDDLHRVRSRVATEATLTGELPSGRMQRLGRVWTYSAEYRSLESELERINAVSLDELREVAAAFPCTPRVTGCLTPEPVP